MYMFAKYKYNLYIYICMDNRLGGRAQCDSFFVGCSWRGVNTTRIRIRIALAKGSNAIRRPPGGGPMQFGSGSELYWIPGRGPMQLGSGSELHWSPSQGANAIGIRIPIALEPLTGQGVQCNWDL